jgi:hypothetical protein
MKAFAGKLRITNFLAVFLITPLVLIFVYFLAVPNPNLAAGSDFLSYYAGASIIKNGKTDLIYDISTQRQFFEDIIYPLKGTITNRFISPPYVALLYFPFTFINYFIAYKIFFIVNLGVFFLFLCILRRVFRDIFQKYNFLYIIPFYFFPVAMTLFMGQTSYILAILFLFIYLLLVNNKSRETGILSAVLLIKPQYVFAIPFFLLLVKEKRQFLQGFFITTFSLLLISLLLVGHKALFDYLPFMLSTENPDFGNRAQQMFSFHSAISYLFFKSNLSSIYPFILNSGAYILFLYLFKKRKSKISIKTAFILIVFLTLLFSLHVLNHDLVLLILPIFILLDSSLKERGRIEVGRLITPILIFILPSLSIFDNTFAAICMLFVISSLILIKPSVFEIR